MAVLCLNVLAHQTLGGEVANRNSRRWCYWLGVLLLLLSSLPVVAQTPVPVVTGLTNPGALAVDGNYIYFGENAGATSILSRAPKSGGAKEQLLPGFPQVEGGIHQIDFSPTHIYYGAGGYVSSRIEELPRGGSTTRLIANLSGSSQGGAFLGLLGPNVYYFRNFCCIQQLGVGIGSLPTQVASGVWPRSQARDATSLYFVAYFDRNLYRYDAGTVNALVPLITGNASEGAVFLDSSNAYLAVGTFVKKVSKIGGTVTPITLPSGAQMRAVDDAFIYFTINSQLWRQSATGVGAAELVVNGVSIFDRVTTDANFLYWADTSAGNGAGVIYRLQKDRVQEALLSRPLPVNLPPTQSLLQPSPVCVVPSATPSPTGGVCFQRVAASPLAADACVPPDATDNPANLCAIPSPMVTTASGYLILHQSIFNKDKPTVVISHGWNAGSSQVTPLWESRMAQAVGDQANVFLWNWMDKAKSRTLATMDPGCRLDVPLDLAALIACDSIPYANVELAGKDLGAALQYAICRWDPSACLGSISTYTKPIHFVGHSLGTGVIIYAARYLMDSKFKNNIDELTLLDSAYLTTPPGGTTLPDLKLRSPNPVFVDSYKSLVGVISTWSYNPNLVSTSIILPSLAGFTGVDCRTGLSTFGLTDALGHGYGNWWYISSYEDFSCPSILDDFPPRPPLQSYGTRWAPERDNFANNRGNAGFIYASLSPFAKWYLVPVSQLPKLAAGVVTYATGQVVDLTQKTLDVIQTTAVKTVTKVVVLSTKAFNTAQDTAEWAVDKAENAFWAIKDAGTAAANGVIRLKLNSSATVHAPVFIPPTATSMRFSFAFVEASAGTTLEVFLNDRLVYITRGEDLPGKGQQVSDWLEIAPFAGKQVTMSFRLSNPVEGNRGTVDLDDIVIANVIAAGGPFALAKAPTTARQSTVITLDGTGSIDPEPGPQQVTFLWSQLQGSTVQLVNGQSARPSFIAGTSGSYSFSLVVNDGQAASVPSFVTIVVPKLGDIDGDGDVDSIDLARINAALNTNASGPNDLRDLDGDGRITGLDARKLVTLCTRARCATQ